MEKEFIRNVLDIDVNGFTGTTRYVVSAMYDVIHEDEDGSTWASIESKIIEDVTMTSQMIEEEGGHAAIVEQLKELYNIYK